MLSDVSLGERPARLETARACAETRRTLSLYRRALTAPAPNPEPSCAERRAVLAVLILTLTTLTLATLTLTLTRCAESRAVLAAGGVESLDMLLLERPGALAGVRVRVRDRVRGRDRGRGRVRLGPVHRRPLALRLLGRRLALRQAPVGLLARALHV